MSIRVYYECGCIGNISSHDIFMRIYSCQEHGKNLEFVKPESDEIKRVETGPRHT